MLSQSLPEIQLIVDPNPSPHLSEWVNQPGLAVFTVRNNDPDLEGAAYRIKVEMYLENNLVVNTNNNVSVQYLDLYSAQVFFAEDIIPSSALEFPATLSSGAFQNNIIQTGMLPAGIYDFCVSIVSVNGEFATTNPPVLCNTMLITDYQMPELINPAHNLEISSTLLPSTIFTWSPMSPPPPANEGVKYIIAVSEVYDGQSPSQAFLVNYPIIEEEIIVGTQFMWPIDFESPDETQQYVWSVKAVNDNDIPYKLEANGFVPPETFIINPIISPKSGNITDTICMCWADNPPMFTNGQLINTSPLYPNITISQPEPVNYPRKVQLDGVIQYRDYLFNCVDSMQPAHTITATINWGSTHSSENIMNNGSFQHEYGVGHDTPDSICITYKIENRPSYPEFLCEKEVCIQAPQSILDLNTIDNNGTVNAGETFYVGEVVSGQGEFSVLVDSIVSTNNKHTGKGTIAVPWLASRMAVEFTDITLNSILNLSSGEVVVESYPTSPDTTQIGSVYVGSVTSFINNHGSYSTTMEAVSGSLSAINYITTPKKMPLGIKSSKGDSISLFKMTFLPNRSEYDLVTLKQTSPKFQSQNIGFKATNIRFSPINPVSVPDRIELVENVLVGNTNSDVYFYFIAPTTNNVGCYIDFDENGFQQFGVEVSAEFTRDWFTPIPDNGISRSKASMSVIATDWDDLILTGIFEKSQIVATNGYTILADDMSFDMSDVLNPSSITFPSNYQGETTNLFTGFYMEELTLELPTSFQTPTGGKINVSVTDMIIDNTGLTLIAEATNIIQFNSAKVANLSCGIDTVYVEIESNSLVDAYIKGEIGLPLSKSSTIQNPLRYVGLFHHTQGPLDSNYFHLTIDPQGPIYADLLKSDIVLDATSNISAHVGPNEKSFEIDLNGSLEWVDDTLGPIKNVNLKLDFEGMEMGMSTSTSTFFTFDAGSWAFASPQKRIANFPVSITNIYYENLPKSGNQLVNGQLNLDVIFNLSSEIGGSTSLGLMASIEDHSSSGGDKFFPKFDGAVIDSINIQANMSAVSINGAIGFRNNDPVFGDGFKGTLSADFKAGITASALAEFGNTNYLSSSLYRYWRVEAEATFPSPGIVFLPGLSFRGFGGGAYKNMDVSLNSSGTSYNFTPLQSNFGFIAQAVIATSPEEKSFNADCSLLAQFSQSNGITNINFTGDFYVGASLSTTSRAKAQIIGDLGVSYDFPLKHFNLSANVNVNASPITTPTPASLVLDINGKTNKWYFKFGEPTNLNTVNVMGVSLYEYLMFGNDITGPSGFTNDFTTAYNNAVGVNPSANNLGSGGVGVNTATGKGFALGIGFMFDDSGDIILTKWNNKKKKHTLFYGLSAGAELHLSYLEYQGSCGGYTPMGINGFRAKGGLGFYGTATASIRKYKKNTQTIKWDKTIADIRAGAWINGEFPNPNYAAGAIDGSVNMFDLVNFNFHLDFETGTSCSNGGVVSTTVVPQGDAAADQQNLLVQYVNPTQSFNFPTTSPLVVKYGLVPDEVFDVAEQQADGTIINRMFKLVVARYLEMQDPITNIWSSVPIKSDENNLGEFLHTISPLPTQAAGSLEENSFSVSPPPTQAAGSLVENPFSVSPPPTQAAGSLVENPFSISNMVVAGGGLANTGMGQAPNSMSLVYPPASVPTGYANLPPEPDPIVNTLLDDINYRFTVTATLKEFTGGSWTTSGTNTGGSWINALKIDTTPVTQTVIKTFRTGDMQLLSSNTTF